MPSIIKPLTGLVMALAVAGCGGGKDLRVGAGPPPGYDTPTGPGPQGASQGAPGEGRYDEVGYASWYGEEMGSGRTASGRPFDPGAITAAHLTLPLGSFVEITALDSGKTIVAMVDDRGPYRGGRLVDLSRGAAQALGIDRAGIAAVRVRRVDPPIADQAALREGRAASPRIDAPPVLIKALRRRLPPAPNAAAPPPFAAAPKPPRERPGASYGVPGQAAAAPAAASRAGFYVQVAAFASRQRAEALAQGLNGSLQAAGSIYRVRLGPYADQAAAERARDAAAARGYGDARIVRDE
ncbi:MAG: hypothetical protein B7Y45_06695 [Sphingomonas sp. 28-66-16]|nr:MAG: hypothetical protein B7Y45_06695 [Sphingomonas sp. 28-66-16]